MTVNDGPLARILEFEVSAVRVPNNRVGEVTRFDETGLYVDYPGNPHGPLPVQLAMTLDAREAAAAAAERRAAVLAFEDERSDRPILMGLLTPVPLPASPSQPMVSAVPAVGTTGFVTEVDGKRLVVEAQDEIVLRCGEASITLRRNGRLAIRGVYVETRARGVNRIRGGTVQIN
jgi:Domain of unknown function (DUF6484)